MLDQDLRGGDGRGNVTPEVFRNAENGLLLSVNLNFRVVPSTPTPSLYHCEGMSLRVRPRINVNRRLIVLVYSIAAGYTVGKDEVITLEIKPTSHSGVLLSSSSINGDYIVLEMIRGNVTIDC